MKKNVKLRIRVKFISVLMATLLLFGLCNPTAYASTIIDAEAQANLYAIRSTASAEAYNMLLDEIFDGNMYVPDYAGAYMDVDGTLVVCVLDDAAVESYKSILTTDVLNNYISSARSSTKQLGRTIGTNATISPNNLIRYETRTYSYNTLDAIQNSLNELMIYYEIASTSIIQQENTIHISTVNDARRSEITEFISNIGYPTDVIIYEHMDDYGELTATTVHPGQSLAVQDQDNAGITEYGTVGFYARSGNICGVVTAGHVAFQNGQLNSLGQAPVLSQYRQQGGNLDAAFVPINTTYFNPTRIVYAGGTATIRTYAAPVESYVVTIYGHTYASIYNADQVASIRSTSTTHTYQGITYTDLIELNKTVMGGDSGGPVLFGSVLVGIVHGNNGGYGLACKVTNIMNRWGLTLVTDS